MALVDTDAPVAQAGPARELQLDLALDIRLRSSTRWRERPPLNIVGRHPALAAALERLALFAAADGPVLITGETGTGKELFARALCLLSRRVNGPFISINCAQYVEGHLIASELFGHRKGSFTGALADHPGVFAAADGGTVFLDEVAELSPTAQAMLLRALSEGEIVPVGETRARAVNVRVIAATGRDMTLLVEKGQFRPDLYYRLRCLNLRLPPLRERGDDWKLILHSYLESLGAARAHAKAFSEDSLRALRGYHWPGNVREVKSVVETGFHLSGAGPIEPLHFLESLESASRSGQFTEVEFTDPIGALYDRMRSGESFWSVVHAPFLDRELSRQQVRGLVTRGLRDSRGSYKRLLATFALPAGDYLRFMDFLRHHDLKPID